MGSAVGLAERVRPVGGGELLRFGQVAAWALPGDEHCAQQARTLVAGTLAELGLDEQAVDTAATVVTELATNTLHVRAHAQLCCGRPLRAPELWMYLRALCEKRGSELVISVFDAGDGFSYRRRAPDRRAMGGRGLWIVDQFAERWGHRLSRSRLAERPYPGATAWFALSTELCAQMPTWTAGEAAWQLGHQLHTRGVEPMAVHTARGQGRVWARPGVVITCCDGVFAYSAADGYRRRRLTDLAEVTEEVIAMAEAAIRRPPAQPRQRSPADDWRSM